MSCLENDRLYENTREAFFEALDNDHNFHDFIYENFLDHQEQWIEAKMTCEIDPDVYGLIFENLWNWNEEQTCFGFKTAARYYVNQQEDMKEAKREWEQFKGVNQ
jgi:hypothetical protein